MFESTPPWEELVDKKPTQEEMAKNTNGAMEWYQNAIDVAARLMIQEAQKNDDFRQEFLDGESAHIMTGERWAKIEALGLSANQGYNAERKARHYLDDG